MLQFDSKQLSTPGTVGCATYHKNISQATNPQETAKIMLLKNLVPYNNITAGWRVEEGYVIQLLNSGEL